MPPKTYGFSAIWGFKTVVFCSFAPAGPPSAPSKRADARKSGKYSEGFERFWQSYPKNLGGKAAAFAKWQSGKCEPETEVILAGLAAYLAEHARLSGGKEFAPAHPYAERWLSRRQWEVTPAAEQSTPDGAAIDQSDGMEAGLRPHA